MSRSLGDQLPAPLVELMNGENLAAKASHAILLHTVDARGRPHPAMLSVGEVLARAPRTLRLALYPHSSTSNNLRRGDGALTLALAHGDFAYYVKAQARELPDPEFHLGGLAGFEATVDEVLEDGEAIAQVTSGFAIALTGDAAQTVSIWEQQIAGLRAIP